MKLTIFQIDAFTDQVFHGNPAAVCILDKWPEDQLMQNIAAENNLAETAFTVKKSDHYEIRWFTPTLEVDLCGHATLATAHVLYNHCDFNEDQIDFISPRSGLLSVEKSGNKLTLDFPSDTLKPTVITNEMHEALGVIPKEAYKGKTDYLFVFPSENEIEELKPNLGLIAQLDCRGVIVTAPGDLVDFASRFVAPQSGIDEDPVTGSAHTTLTPYWSKRLRKTRLTARQLSGRKGDLVCEYLGARVKITGSAVTYMVGEIEV